MDATEQRKSRHWCSHCRATKTVLFGYNPVASWFACAKFVGPVAFPNEKEQEKDDYTDVGLTTSFWLEMLLSDAFEIVFQLLDLQTLIFLKQNLTVIPVSFGASFNEF